MISASAFPETWPAGPATRPCYGAYFQHPATERQPAALYDNYGPCLLAMPTTLLPEDSGMSIWTVVMVAGLVVGGYFVWKNRKSLF